MVRLPRLPARHRAWVAAKLIVAAWMIVYAILTPPATSAVLGAFIWVVASTASIGIITSIVGMLVAIRGGKFRTGRIVELSGLILAAAGPVIHAATLLWIMVPALIDGDPEWSGRAGPFMQSAAITAFLVVRFVEVRTRAVI